MYVLVETKALYVFLQTFGAPFWLDINIGRRVHPITRAFGPLGPRMQSPPAVIN